MHMRMRHFLGVAVMALFTIPAIYYTHDYVFALELWDGDEVEERECRECGGSGEDLGLALEMSDMPGMPGSDGRCPFCAGGGKVQVIVPGPNRPTRIRGFVLDGRRVPDRWNLALGVGDPEKPFQRHPAAVEKASVVFTPAAGESVSKLTNGHGKFGARLAPGHYHYLVRSLGGAKLEGEITVEELTVPIWIEKAKLVREMSSAEARSVRGMVFRAVVGGDAPRLWFEPASPLDR